VNDELERILIDVVVAFLSTALILCGEVEKTMKNLSGKPVS
jgi:hypothetical protein